MESRGRRGNYEVRQGWNGEMEAGVEGRKNEGRMLGMRMEMLRELGTLERDFTQTAGIVGSTRWASKKKEKWREE